MSQEPEQIKPEGDITALMQHHESEDNSSLTSEEALLVAGFARNIGNELHTVDHSRVDGSHNNKALQIDKQKIFNNARIERSQPSQPQQVSQPQPVATNQPRPVATNSSNTLKPVEQPVAVSSDIETRIRKLENQFSKYIKKPHKKFSVKFKSSVLSGTFDEFEDLIDAVRKSLNKSCKRITISLNEN